jgi:hypothetical protein
MALQFFQKITAHFYACVPHLKHQLLDPFFMPFFTTLTQTTLEKKLD